MQSRHVVLSVLALLSVPLSYSCEPSSSSAAASPPWYEQPDDVLEDCKVDGVSLLAMKQVYATAPDLVKGTVEHLKDPKYYGPTGAPEYRFLLLHGDSGAGKSTLARAIGRYANWDVEFTYPSDYQIGNRGDAALAIRKRVNSIIARNTPTILVMDEGNQMLENYNSDKHDTDATSKEIWTTIDRVNGNDKFFMILTANRIHKMPKQMKTRCKARQCEIKMPDSVDGRMNIFMNILSRSKLALSSKAAEVIKKVIQAAPKWSGRDYAEYVFEMKHVARDVQKRQLTLGYRFQQDTAEQSVVNMLGAEDKFVYNAEDLTNDERQDLYQAQNIYSQLNIQRLQKVNMPGRPPGITTEASNFIADNLLSQSQARVSKDSFNVDKLREKQ